MIEESGTLLQFLSLPACGQSPGLLSVPGCQTREGSLSSMVSVTLKPIPELSLRVLKKGILNLGSVGPFEMLCKIVCPCAFPNQSFQSSHQMLVLGVAFCIIYLTGKSLFHIYTNFHCVTELQRMLREHSKRKVL